MSAQGSKVGTQFAVLFGGVFWADKFQANPLATDLIEDWKAGPLQIPSIHIIGQRDSIKKVIQLCTVHSLFPRCQSLFEGNDNQEHVTSNAENLTIQIL